MPNVILSKLYAFALQNVSSVSILDSSDGTVCEDVNTLL